MNPTSSPESSPKELLERGVSGVKYLERFGGYGKQTDLGCLQFQVMQIFDYLMDENLRQLATWWRSWGTGTGS